MKNNKYCILVLDDEEVIVEQLKDIFEDDYEVFITTDPLEGLDMIKRENIDLVISDQRMPKMTGTNFLVGVKNENEDVVRILLTGYSDLNAAIQAINNGSVHRYEQKPIDINQLRGVIIDELRKYERQKEIKKNADAFSEFAELSKD
ncbi:MAG: response regulator [Deltaproteobacteria bacterium]|nr:response regulator [Deltaproteobacteria bacterium]